MLKLTSFLQKMFSKIFLVTTAIIGITVYVLLSTQRSPCYSFAKVPQISAPPQIDPRIYDKMKTFLIFIGYNRSRHTLLASLLDAHPNVIIANDFNILRQWIEDPLLSRRSKYFIYELLIAKSRYDVMFGVRSRTVGNKPAKYHYNVKSQWQGRYNKTIKVIGDKKAAQASRILLQAEGMEALKRLEKKLGVQLKFVHVIRNPFDNIATMVLRRADLNKKGQEKLTVNYSSLLDGTISNYSTLAKGSLEAIKNFPGRVHNVASIDVLKKTKETLIKICDFLEITCSEKYLNDCASIVDPVPSETRHNVEWSKEQRNRVHKLIHQIPFLRRYSFGN